MNKMRLAAVIAAASLALTSCGANGSLKKVAMEIGGQKITAGDIATLNMIESGADNFDTGLSNVSKMIESYAKYNALGKAMKIELTDEDKASGTEIRSQIASSNGGYKKFKKYMEENSSSIEFLDMLGQTNAYYSYVNEKIDEKIGDKQATDEELQKYYNDNYMCVKHIVIKADDANGVSMDDAKKKAEEVLAKLNEGGDFVALMKEYSEDKDSDGNDNCGETGYVFAEGDFGNPAFEDAAAALKPGEYTKELVKVEGGSYSGYHIIMRLELPAEMGDNKDAVTQGYEQKQREDIFDALCEEYGIKIKINQEVIDSIKASMLTELPKTENDDNAAKAY